MLIVTNIWPSVRNVYGTEGDICDNKEITQSSVSFVQSEAEA